MLLLALLSLAVGTAFSDNQWQLRISSNQWSEQRAEQAASSALSWAESWLMSQPGELRPLPCRSSCSAAQVILTDDALPPGLAGLNETWWLDNGHADGLEPASGTLLAARSIGGSPGGRWLVQEIHHEPADGAAGTPEISYFRVTARAPRAPRGTPVLLETIVARPWGSAAWRDALPASGSGFCSAPGVPAHCGRLSWRRRQ
jgi:Tfp pilus assembly protein PilX